jgi:hypothetical protein
MLIGASGSLSIKKMSRSERLFKSVLRKASSQFSIWTLSWAEFGRTRGAFWMKRGMGILTLALFTIAGQSVYGIAHWFFPFLPLYGWFLMLFATTILAQTFVIHYSAIAHERIQREKVEELEEQVWLLGDRLYPNLQIDYRPDEEEPFVQAGNRVTQYRLSVKSPEFISDAELVVNHLKVSSLPRLFDVHLRPMHDRDLVSGTKRVALPADREKYCDLISWFSGEPYGIPAVLLNCIPALGTIQIPTGDYEFEVMATGGNRPKATKIINLTVAADGAATLAVRDGRLSSPLA